MEGHAHSISQSTKTSAVCFRLDHAAKQWTDLDAGSCLIRHLSDEPRRAGPETNEAQGRGAQSPASDAERGEVSGPPI